MAKQNDTLTLLNLACIKYTGCSLPISDYTGNNWKYIEFEDFSLKKLEQSKSRKGVWSPHPYFNPLHLYYPSYDFGARVLRSLIVEEIDFIKHGEQRMRDIMKKQLNPYGYRGAQYDIHNGVRKYREPIRFACSFEYGSQPAKLQQLFLKDVFYTTGCNDGYPQKPRGRYTPDWNKHAERTIKLDKKIFRDKCNRIRWREKFDIFTKKGDLRKLKLNKIAEDIHTMREMAQSMSYAGYYYYVVGYSCSAEQLRRAIVRFDNGRNATQPHLSHKIAAEYRVSPHLTPDEFVRIFNSNHSSKNAQEKINQKLIANFPH